MDENERQEKEESGEKDDLGSIENPVLPGDFADPSVVRVGDDYWATATSSEWAPLFPILHSKNLKDWKIKAHVFPDGPPKWAETHFWAPEITYDNGKFYIYYTAKEKGKPLCVAVATSDKPTGPYTDLGPLVCQEAGSIDGFPIRNDEGKLFLIWKEDGNSRGEPTIMWGQEMREDRSALIGERFELFRNDPETWENKVVEGAFLIKKDGFYYAFYAGGACCGRNCNYGVGVARAEQLKGPWVKYEGNPIKQHNDEWKCAGHGSLVQSENGKYYFLYHAYDKDGFVYTGRQGMLDEIIWEEEGGWPKFREANPREVNPTQDETTNVEERFTGKELSQYWQWPVGNKPEYTLEGGSLVLSAQPEKIGAVLARRTFTTDYEATARLDIPSSGSTGLAAIGDPTNALGISVSEGEVFVWKMEKGKNEIISTESIEGVKKLTLKIVAKEGHLFDFFFSQDGENWKKINGTLNGNYLPPWDRAVRIGVVSKGGTEFENQIDTFNILPLETPSD